MKCVVSGKAVKMKHFKRILLRYKAKRRVERMNGGLMDSKETKINLGWGEGLHSTMVASFLLTQQPQV